MKPQFPMYLFMCICKVNITGMYEGNGSINFMSFMQCSSNHSSINKVNEVNAHPYIGQSIL